MNLKNDVEKREKAPITEVLLHKSGKMVRKAFQVGV
jgi:hypothetical protein